MYIAKDWKDYELIDIGDGLKLERWGEYYFLRPEPQAVWPMQKIKQYENKLNAVYHRSASGGGSWEIKKPFPESWKIRYKDLSFHIRPTGFKHMGLFPEQAYNWDRMIKLICDENKQVSVLNLFAYTGGATVACASAGAKVVHLDSAKGIVSWAKQNAELSGLGNSPIRYIVDDALKFVKREKRRGSTYDAIIMDPPSYGRGPTGEMWKIEDNIYELIVSCKEILSDHPIFFMVNSYTTGLSPTVIVDILNLELKSQYKGHTESDELTLPIKNNNGIFLPCGATSIWQR